MALDLPFVLLPKARVISYLQLSVVFSKLTTDSTLACRFRGGGGGGHHFSVLLQHNFAGNVNLSLGEVAFLSFLSLPQI